MKIKEFVQRCLMKKRWRKIEENLILFVDSSGYLRSNIPPFDNHLPQPVLNERKN